MAMPETLPPDPRDPPDPRGEAMVAELRWVHDMIRRDLETVRRMAADVAAGRSAEQIRAGLASLAAGGPLWQLRINCLQYCRFVHSHHHAESVMLFPALRQANPALNPVVDKLEADHLNVSRLLSEVEAAARALGEREDPALRERLAAALLDLSTDLLAHLEYEEEHICDTLRTWSRWPFW
jgi:Hemerythrin HHE cation binding domain